MKQWWWVIPIIAIIATMGAISAQAVFASHLPVPYVVGNQAYPEPREDVQSWVFHISYEGKDHFVYPTNPLGMGGPQEYGFYVDDWTDWGHDPLPHWIFWWKDWQGKTHHYTGLGQVVRRTVSPDGTQDGVRGESVFAGKVKLADGKVAYNCYARAIPQDFQISEWGDINPWTREHTNEHVNTPYCVFSWPIPPTPTATATPVATATPAPCCPPPPPQAGCVATQESWGARYGTDWYPGRPGTGFVEVHVWWPDYPQERKLLLEPWQRPGLINAGGSAWSWPVGCEEGARSAFQNQATWIPQVSLDRLRTEGRVR